MGKLLNVADVLAATAVTGGADFSVSDIGTGSAAFCAGIDEVVRVVESGGQAHFVTNGAWSQHQLIAALLRLSGPATVLVSSYAMCENAVRMFAQAIDAGAILRLYAAIDNRIETRTAGSLQLLRSIATRIALMPCHAKVTVLAGANASIVVIGSANYTENKRVEVGFAMNSRELADMHSGWITKLIAEHGD